MASPLSPQFVRDRLRQHDALLLRAAGMTFDEIASRLGYAHRGSAYRAVRAALARNEQVSIEAFRLKAALDVMGLMESLSLAFSQGDTESVRSVMARMENPLRRVRAWSSRFEVGGRDLAS